MTGGMEGLFGRFLMGSVGRYRLGLVVSFHLFSFFLSGEKSLATTCLP